MKLRTAPVFVAAFAALITLLAQAQQPGPVSGAAPGKDKAKAKGGGVVRARPLETDLARRVLGRVLRAVGI